MNDKLIEKISNYILECIGKCENNDINSIIKPIFDMIINELNLQQDIGEIIILDVYDKNHSSRGMVDDKGNIKLFRTGIEKTFEEVIKEIPNLTEYEKSMCKCLLYVKTFLHELEHIKQRKILADDKENNSVETLIIKLCEAVNNNDVAYFCLYDSYPTERLAEIKSFRILIKIIENLENKSEISLLSDYFKKYALFEEFYKYYQYGLSGPTEKFFEFWNPESLSVLKSEKLKNEINIEDRLLYGLEISVKEYEKIVLQYADFDKKIKSLSNGRKR